MPEDWKKERKVSSNAYIYNYPLDAKFPRDIEGEHHFEVVERPLLFFNKDVAELAIDSDHTAIFEGVRQVHYAGDITVLPAAPTGAGNVLEVESGVVLIVLDDRAFLIKISPSENGYLISTREISKFYDQHFDIAVAEYILAHASEFQIDIDLEYAAVYSDNMSISGDISFTPPEWFRRGVRE